MNILANNREFLKYLEALLNKKFNKRGSHNT